MFNEWNASLLKEEEEEKEEEVVEKIPTFE